MKSKVVNPQLKELITELERVARQHDAPIWRKVAELLSRSKRSRVIVNVAELMRNTAEGEKIVIPGKVLGAGTACHGLTVAAFRFSPQAKEKLEKVDCTCISILDVLKENPHGTGIRLLR
jgi:large subunit ribosomal protein L18e